MTDWSPRRFEDGDPEEEHIDKLRLPEKREEDPLRRVLTIGAMNEGYRQIADRLGSLVNNWDNLNSTGTWTTIDETEQVYFVGCLRPPGWEFPVGHSGFGDYNHFFESSQRVYLPDWNISQEKFNKYPKILTREWLESLREGVDSVYRLQWEPNVGHNPNVQPDFDPENPEFQWVQPLTDKLLSWEYEILQQRLAAVSWRKPQIWNFINSQGEINALRPEHVGPWPASDFSFDPYPEGPPPPPGYNPEDTIDIDATVEKITKTVYEGRIGLFWAFGGRKQISRRDGRGCTKPDGELVTDTVQYQTAETIGLVKYGPIAYDGTFVDATGVLTIPHQDIWVRQGNAVLNDDDQIIFDDTYNSVLENLRIRLYVVQQHPFHPEVLLKPTRDQFIYMPGIKSWFDYFPGFDKSLWPYEP